MFVNRNTANMQRSIQCFQEFDTTEGNDRLEESCSCDLNSIDNTESDGSPAIVKSRSETLDTAQSSEAISLDSRLSDKPETPTTAREIHTDTPTILEEGNSEAASIPTTQETSEAISIESSSDFYSEVHKIEGSSPDSMVVQEVLKKDDDPSEVKSQDETVPPSEKKTVEESVEARQEEDAEQPKETTRNNADECNVSHVQKDDETEGETEEMEGQTEVEAGGELEAETGIVEACVEAGIEVEADGETEVEAPSRLEEARNKETSSSVDKVASNEETSADIVLDKEEERTEKSVEEDVVASTEQADSEHVPSSVPSSETPEPLIIKDIEKLQLENDREVIDSDTSEAYLTPTENQDNLGDMKPKEAEKTEDSEKGAGVDVEKSENDAEETGKNSNCSTSVIESNVADEKKKDVDVDEEKVDTVVVTSELSSEKCAVDSVKEEKSAVVNVDNGVKVTDKHSREPSTISTNVSDNQSDIPVRTENEVEVTDSVCSNSDIQSSVDNVTQVPNPKQQIPTISTVCDANKNMPDGVPQIVSSTVVARDNSLLNELTSDHVDAHRRSSLPAVSSETTTDDNNVNEPPSLPVPLRKTSSPQKRPRSASTSTQVDPNHFGKKSYPFSSLVFPRFFFLM